MENKTTFKRLAKLIKIEAAQQRENSKHYINNGFCLSWPEDRHEQSDNGLKQHSTTLRWEQYQNGNITREKAVEFALKRRYKEIDGETIIKLDKLLKAQAAEDIKTVSISVIWKRNRTWGWNPTATVVINGIYIYEGSASGCGYDKRTAAIGSALNQSDIILKMLYTAKEKALKKPPQKGRQLNPFAPEDKAIYEENTSNNSLIHYGAGYGVLPYFEGGVGISSFIGVFKACGLELKHESGTDTTDYYYFEV